MVTDRVLKFIELMINILKDAKESGWIALIIYNVPFVHSNASVTDRHPALLSSLQALQAKSTDNVSLVTTWLLSAEILTALSFETYLFKVILQLAKWQRTKAFVPICNIYQYILTAKKINIPSTLYFLNLTNVDNCSILIRA